MRPIREITAAEENFRMVPLKGYPNMSLAKRDPVEPEPIGTIVLMAFRVTGYDSDCDGGLMARLENIGSDGQATGWETDCHGLYPSTEVVVTLEEWAAMFQGKDPAAPG